MPLRSIPPNTVMRSIYPTNRNAPPKKQKKKVYYKPKRNTPMPRPTNTFTTKEIPLDLFEDGNELKVIGDFPGVTEEDLVIQIIKNELCVVTKPSIDRKYQAVATLLQSFQTILKSIERRNGIMTLILEQVKFEKIPTELQRIFDVCLKKFPELKNIALRLVKSRRHIQRDTVEGAKGKAGTKDIIILFAPELLWGKWGVFKPIIFHELAHFINLEDPDEVFYKRADRKSIQLWDMLKDNGQIDCKVEK